MQQVTIRVARAGNGVPCFTATGFAQELARPFGASWDDERHLWMYPAYYPMARRVIEDFDVLSRSLAIDMSEMAQRHWEAVKREEEQYKARHVPDGFTFVTKPFDHQIEGLCQIHYMMRSGLFYAPGLGKSKCAVDAMRLERHLGYRDLFIVMGPLISIRNWGKEIDLHSDKALKWAPVFGTPEEKREVIERAKAREFDVLLVTYDTARLYTDQIFEVPYRQLFADESHLIKEYKSGRTKAAIELGQKAARKTLMTGTPTLGNPMDLYGQFKFLADYLMPETYHVYQRRYLQVLPADRHVVIGYKNMDILNARTTFISTTKTKEECLDLPERMMVDVEYGLSLHQANVYNQLIDLLGVDAEGLLAMLAGRDDAVPPSKDLAHAAARLNKLMQVCSGFLITNNMDPRLCDNVEEGGCRWLRECVANEIEPYTRRCRVQPEKIPDTITRFKKNPKLEALAELLDSTLGDERNKVIVWCYYQEELDMVEERLKDLGLGYVRVDGSTGEDVFDLAERFNQEPGLRVYLAQISTGVSITLNAASYMVFYSLTFNLKDYLQAIDRNHRIGQRNVCTVFRLRGKHTIEPGIARLLDNKMDVNDALTKKLACLACPHNVRCFAEDIRPFAEGCVYKRNMGRPVMKAQHVPAEEAA